MRCYSQRTVRTHLRLVPPLAESDLTPAPSAEQDPEERALRLLAYVTNGHMPHEVRVNLEALAAAQPSGVAARPAGRL